MNSASGNTQNLSLFQRGYTTNGAVNFTICPLNQELLLQSYCLYNGSTSTVSDLGLGIAFNTGAYRVYQHLGTSDTDITAQLQAGTATTIIDTTTAHGYMIECKKPFGFVAFNISQASTGSPTYTYQYWNGAWTSFTPLQAPVYSSTGLVYLTFNPPADWIVGDGGLGVNTGYAIRLVTGTAPSQAVQANKIVVARWVAYRPAVSGQGQLQVIWDEKPYLLETGEAIQPYFSLANAASCVEVAYQIAP